MDTSSDSGGSSDEHEDELLCYNCQADLNDYEEAYYDLTLDKSFCETCYYFIQDNK